MPPPVPPDTLASSQEHGATFQPEQEVALSESARDVTYTTSTGFALSEISSLDRHFAIARPEYEAQLRAVGIQPGWRVLDAACGGGSFLPWLTELVGPGGQITALDLTPENVAIVDQRVANWSLPCPVEVRQGNILALPYPDDAFDAVWFANTAQYLTDNELLSTLVEFRRVVRPGGLVAVKDSIGGVTFHPIPQQFIERMQLAVIESDSAEGQAWDRLFYRTPLLRRWLERAGFAEVWQRFTLIERWAPFEPLEREYALDGMVFMANMAAQHKLSAEDQAMWAELSDPTSAVNPANHPESYFSEGNYLAVGRVPQ